MLSGFGIRASLIMYVQVGRRAAPSGTRARTDERSAEGGRRLRAAAQMPQRQITPPSSQDVTPELMGLA
eukprot:4864783-Prymnesium_polylepis.1